jgi:hypothetical protein
MSQVALAEAARVNRTTVIDFESGVTTLQRASMDKIRRALEKAGVEFTDGDQPGLKLRKGKRN